MSLQPMIRFALPGMRTANPLNASRASSRFARARTAKTQRETTRLVLAGLLRVREIELPCAVLVRRVAPSSGLDAHDALPASLKSVVDGIADGLGLPSDRDARVSWRYDQRRGGPGEYSVEIEIVGAPF